VRLKWAYIVLCVVIVLALIFSQDIVAWFGFTRMPLTLADWVR
jgi:hypothetical protein